MINLSVQRTVIGSRKYYTIGKYSKLPTFPNSKLFDWTSLKQNTTCSICGIMIKKKIGADQGAGENSGSLWYPVR